MVRFMKGLLQASLIICLGLAIAGCSGADSTSSGKPQSSVKEGMEKQKKMQEEQAKKHSGSGGVGEADKEKAKDGDKGKGETKKEK